MVPNGSVEKWANLPGEAQNSEGQKAPPSSGLWGGFQPWETERWRTGAWGVRQTPSWVSNTPSAGSPFPRMVARPENFRCEYITLVGCLTFLTTLQTRKKPSPF